MGETGKKYHMFFVVNIPVFCSVFAPGRLMSPESGGAKKYSIFFAWER